MSDVDISRETQMAILGGIGVFLITLAVFWMIAGPDDAPARPAFWLLNAGGLLFLIAIALEFAT